MIDEMKSLLQYAFKTKNAPTPSVFAPGSADMGICFANLVEPSETGVVCQNG
jgi:alanine-glyoxylate transaminase/serine-glyoxylate transaminase/serine-pyruvate transaminase